MSTERLMQQDSRVAASDLSAKQFFAVVIKSTGKIDQAVAAKNMDGILQDKPKAGDVGVYCRDGFCKAAISASQTLAIGDELEVDTAGTLKAVASGTIVAKAMEAVVSVAKVTIAGVEILRSNALDS